MTAANLATCPKCQASNPLGAKFCAGCRNPLKAAGPNPTPPPPPPRPQGLNSLMTGTANAEVVQLAADAGAAHEHIMSWLEKRKGSEIVAQAAPAQISAKVVFKHWLSTLGFKVKVDADVQIAAIAPGQCQVSVTSKTDGSSTGVIWGSTAVIWVLGVFSLGFNPILLLMAAIAVGSTFWLLQSEPGAAVSQALLTDLQKHAPKLSQAPSASPSPSPAAPVPPVAPASPTPPKPDTEHAAAPKAEKEDDEEVFERIAKLAKLRDAGAISEAEFDAKKTELMARI